jgi:hypothetical protein
MGDPVIPAGETLWKDGQTFTESTDDVRADVLRIADGAVIHFKNGIKYVITCNKLKIDGFCFFECGGINGTNGVTPPRRTPDAYVTLATPNQHADAHHTFAYVWPTRDDMIGANASGSTPGTDASSLTIFFKQYEGAQIDPDKQSNALGGKGGQGARGGEGQVMHCTCGATLQAHSGRDSFNSPDGKNGKVQILPIGHPVAAATWIG